MNSILNMATFGVTQKETGKTDKKQYKSDYFLATKVSSKVTLNDLTWNLLMFIDNLKQILQVIFVFIKLTLKRILRTL